MGLDNVWVTFVKRLPPIVSGSNSPSLLYKTILNISLTLVNSLSGLYCNVAAMTPSDNLPKWSAFGLSPWFMTFSAYAWQVTSRPPRGKNQKVLNKIKRLNSSLEYRYQGDDDVQVIDVCPKAPQFYCKDLTHFNFRGSFQFAKRLSDQLPEVKCPMSM